MIEALDQNAVYIVFHFIVPLWMNVEAYMRLQWKQKYLRIM